MNAIWKDCGLSELAPMVSVGGSDAANASASGIPTAAGMGTAGGKIHTLDEYGIVSSLAENAKKIALTALYI